MASVIRVKRRTDEDPAEALHLSCKRQRLSNSSVEIESVLSFAGTIQSKDEVISKHIKDAIRKKKIHKDLHPHSSDFQHSSHVSDITSRFREQREESARGNRYRVTCSRRAFNLDELDRLQPVKARFPKNASLHPQYNSAVKDSQKCGSVELKDKENKADVLKLHPNQLESSDDVKSPAELSARVISKSEAHHSSQSGEHNEGTTDASNVIKDDKMFCLFDVENEEEGGKLRGIKQDSASSITVNNVPMVSSKGRAPLAESEFVYDLYYTHNNLSSLELEAVLMVQTLSEELVHDSVENSERDLVYDDEDDSNDENNWRNDYPDEDPNFFENEGKDYGYTEDMIERNVLDDEADLLAHYMDTGCKVDDSNDESDEYGKDEGDRSSDNEDPLPGL